MSTTWEEAGQMRIATLLGLASLEDELLTEAGGRWHAWKAEHPDARDWPPTLAELTHWLSHSPPAHGDQVLRHLAFLAAHDGGDDLAAAGALAWVLLPGAQKIVCSLARSVPAADEVVAAQLWLQVRTFPWRSGRRVAANIVRNTRKQTLLDVGFTTRSGPTWRHQVLVDPTTTRWQTLALRREVREEDASVTLSHLLAHACRQDVITAADRDLIITLIRAADRIGCERTRGSSGLLSHAVTDHVAQTWGCSSRSVRRRARQTLEDLRAAYNPAPEVSA